MATKREVLEAAARGEGCLGKAKDDEPVFVLVGRDILATGTIQYWMHRLMMHRDVPAAKVEQANEVVREFQLWASKHGTKVPD